MPGGAGAIGLSGMRAEHLKILLQALDLFAFAATGLANAQVPTDVAAGIAMARMTALWKPDGGVRGIVTGDVCLVARVLAKEWAGTFERSTRPFQFARANSGGHGRTGRVHSSVPRRRRRHSHGFL